MTTTKEPLEEKVSKFLQTWDLHCDNDGKKVAPPWGYIKLPMFKQYPILSWSWIKQFFGDRHVLRFCDESCFTEWCVKLGEEKRSTQSA